MQSFFSNGNSGKLCSSLVKTQISCFLFLVLVAETSFCQNSRRPSAEVFTVNTPDYTLSPYTGITRKHWIDAAKYMLDGAFSYIHTLDDAMKFPKQKGKSYPNRKEEIPTEKLEGLCRTLYIAAPLLKENPDLVLNHINVADYYRHQLINFVTPGHPSYIPPRTKNAISQNLVEFGALSISLFSIPDILWHPLTQQQKDALAHTMLSYADGPTVPSNWRFFNLFVFSFFKSVGYEVNEPLMKKFLDLSLADYRGDGWYIDNSSYDYYSMWAYQMYGLLWSEFFGKDNYPEYAKRFKDNFMTMTETYPLMFGRNGQMIMWGRSIAYRFAAISPFSVAGYLNDEAINYGYLRRISSGTLLQFLQNPDLLEDRVPTLGYYGAFEPAVQGYSCRGSVYWMGKAFLSLLLPESNFFWSAKENEGTWEVENKKYPAKNTFLNGPEILITNYSSSGISEIRTSTEMPAHARENWRYSENYNRLSYSSAFPWMADGKNGEIAMNYTFKKGDEPWKPLSVYRFGRYEQEIYYREATLRNDASVKLQLADILLPNGILRVDKATSAAPVEVHLGHYALSCPANGIKEETIRKEGHTAYIMNNEKYELVMIPLYGWRDVNLVHASGLHPESENCAVLNAKDNFTGEKIFVTLLLWNEAGKKFKSKQLFPVKDIQVSNDQKTVVILLNDGTRKIVSW